TVEYSTDLFDATTIRRFVGSFQTLLTAAAANPAARLADLPLMNELERRQVLGEWNDTAVAFPREMPVTRLVEARAAAAPESVAIVDGARVLTYGELNRRANRLARYLRCLDLGADRVVPILLGRSAEMVVAALAVLKAGAAYLPIDPCYPADRVAFMVEDAGASVALTRTTLAASLPSQCELALLVDLVGGAGTVWEILAEESGADLGVDIQPESLAYVIYTSGSTGRPKGVAVQHASLTNLVHWHIRSYELTAEDRGCLTAGPAFDASVWELWPCLAAGARLLVPEESVRLDATRIVEWLRREQVSVCFLPTPVTEAILGLETPELPDLRALLTGGDRLHRPACSALPFSLINHYGPTESTVVATCGRVEAGIAHDPTIGRPIDNIRVCLLDTTGQPVPMGVPGELCIGGGGLARGYLGRPELTAEKFVPDPFSGEAGARLYRTGDLARLLPTGELAFLGRLDHQVKVRGLRIELGEIESALTRHPLVEQAVVLVQTDRKGDQRLVAYVKVAEEPSAAELRKLLRTTLPDYMVPAAFVPLEELPLTPNGKVDRRALPELGAAADPPRGEVEFVAPRTPLEEALAEIWREVLGIERVGVRDRFWDLGGHSLLASKVLARVQDTFGVDLPIQILFEHPVIEDLTGAIGHALLADSGEDAAHVLAELDGLSEEELELLLANPA
ncbi:MAG TPA: amino acid adenylation domain-containing protein, partial [Thermoanaerobaculia bacterium]|nr:amino acid adenylation domain-containing protein [Thermoanaerobaculia bacterium]